MKIGGILKGICHPFKINVFFLIIETCGQNKDNELWSEIHSRENLSNYYPKIFYYD